MRIVMEKSQRLIMPIMGTRTKMLIIAVTAVLDVTTRPSEVGVSPARIMAIVNKIM